MKQIGKGQDWFLSVGTIAVAVAVVSFGLGAGPCCKNKKAAKQPDETNCYLAPMKTPDLKGKKIKWKPPPLIDVGTAWRYVPVGDKNPVTIDNVTIEVTPIGEGSLDIADELLVGCDNPNGERFMVPVYGNLIQIRIHNATGHIVRTAFSELAVEDGAGTVLPIGEEDYHDWLPHVLAAVSSRYRSQLDSLRTALIPVENQLDEELETNFNWYDREYSRCAPVVRQSGVEPTPPAKAKELAAARMAKNLEKAVQRYTNKIDAAEAACLNAVKKATVRKGKFLSRSSFPNQTILPDKSLVAYLPLASHGGELPESLHIRIYDLVTETDAAARPTRRAHFEFELRKQVVR